MLTNYMNSSTIGDIPIMEINQCACSGKTLDRLLRPVVLAMLARGATHGYSIVQQLAELKLFADSPPDTSGIYKVLKAMEKEGLISSEWDLGKSGPAKRRYALTKNGRICLKRWTKTLRDYRAQIDILLEILDAPAPKQTTAKRTNYVQT